MIKRKNIMTDTTINVLASLILIESEKMINTILEYRENKINERFKKFETSFTYPVFFGMFTKTRPAMNKEEAREYLMKKTEFNFCFELYAADTKYRVQYNRCQLLTDMAQFAKDENKAANIILSADDYDWLGRPTFDKD